MLFTHSCSDIFFFSLSSFLFLFKIDVANAYTDGNVFEALHQLMTSQCSCAGGAGVCTDTSIS